MTLGAAIGVETVPTGFEVHLDVYDGPFDLLLGLIAKHKLDITEVALSKVTNDFIAHVKTMGSVGDLEQTTEFLLVASTLLDLKASRLLPQTEVADEEDLALLEARDLLFARLMQYRAFKQVAAVMSERLRHEARRHPRAAAMEERFSQLLPEILISVGPAELAALAAKAMEPKEVPVLSLAHLHAPTVSVQDQAGLIVDRLRRARSSTFRSLVSDAPDTITKVARFLALLELFREGVIGFEQLTPLGELTVRWTGADDGEVEVSAEFDQTEPVPTPAGSTEDDATGRQTSP